MKKRFISYLLLLCLLVAACPLTAAATEADSTEATEAERAPDQCGESMYWAFEGDTLTITGSGKMDDFANEAPWAAFKEEIIALVLDGEITYIGARAFRDYDKLEFVDFGDDLYEIGEEAFYSCEGLQAISMPESFKVFGPSSFLGCKNLKEIHCEGRFPSFRMNSMWDVYATFYYPAERPWPVNTIIELETTFKGRIEFRASDGTDPYVPTEPTEEPTEPTEEPTEATTEPTEETTEPTEATTEPTVVTEAPTEAATEPERTEEPTRETEAPTEPAQEPAEEESGSWMGIILIVAVMCFLVGGALMFRFGGRKRGRYASRGKKR